MSSDDECISFEVNIGIIAACTPMMKPFFRYITARITGRDPHAVLRRSAEQRSFHSSWISRLWPSRSSPSKSQPGQEDRTRRVLPKNETKDVSHTTDLTLNLPLQGKRGSDYIEPSSKQAISDSIGSLQATDVKGVDDRV